MKKFKLIFLLILLSIQNLFAISPTSVVQGIGQSDEIGGTLLPVSINVNYHIYDFDINGINPLEMYFAINGGYGTHEIKQDPITGLAPWSDNFNDIVMDSNSKSKYLFDSTTTKENRTYGYVFCEWDLQLKQAIFTDSLPGKMSFWISNSGRFEQGINKISYIRENDLSIPSVFIKDNSISPIFSGINPPSLIGTPDLKGNHYLLSVGINLGLEYKDELYSIPYTLRLKGFYAPSLYLNKGSVNFNGSSSYFKLSSELYLKKEIVKIENKNLTLSKLFSIELYNNTLYRYLYGKEVPMFIKDAENLRHDINNTCGIYFYGPQFLTEDSYPKLELYYKMDYRWGALNNTGNITSIYPSSRSFSNKIGLLFDLQLFNIFHLSYGSYYTFKDNDGSSGFTDQGVFFWVNV